jgi:hypothetical protein
MIDLNFESSANLVSFGQFGLRVLTGNAIPTETFMAIQVLEDAVISANLLPYGKQFVYIGDTSINALSLSAGTIIYGRFTELEVASGKVIAYKG